MTTLPTGNEIFVSHLTFPILLLLPLSTLLNYYEVFQKDGIAPVPFAGYGLQILFYSTG
jgi:hypothetical protein